MAKSKTPNKMRMFHKVSDVNLDTLTDLFEVCGISIARSTVSNRSTSTTKDFFLDDKDYQNMIDTMKGSTDEHFVNLRDSIEAYYLFTAQLMSDIHDVDTNLLELSKVGAAIDPDDLDDEDESWLEDDEDLDEPVHGEDNPGDVESGFEVGASLDDEDDDIEDEDFDDETFDDEDDLDDEELDESEDDEDDLNDSDEDDDLDDDWDIPEADESDDDDLDGLREDDDLDDDDWGDDDDLDDQVEESTTDDDLDINALDELTEDDWDDIDNGSGSPLDILNDDSQDSGQPPSMGDAFEDNADDFDDFDSDNARI